jgi:hypothetical protein
MCVGRCRPVAVRLPFGGQDRRLDLTTGADDDLRSQAQEIEPQRTAPRATYDHLL